MPQWRHIHNIGLGKWVLKIQNELIFQIQETLKNPLDLYRDLNSAEEEYSINSIGREVIIVIYKFISAYFQDKYDMKIYYENGQSIVFSEKETAAFDDTFDKFPPMMFCKAGSDTSRKYLCCSDEYCRRCITSDHPFAQWLIKNAIKIESCFPRQFQQIVDSLCNKDADEIIKTVNEFRRQLTQLNFNHGIDVTSLLELTKGDFWDPFV